MSELRNVFSLVISLAAIMPLHARIIHVPGDRPTIQGGINIAADGDTVMVAPGTYVEFEIDFLGKAIAVMGTDPGDSAVVAATVVDADSRGVVFVFDSGEDSMSILSGLTISGGEGASGWEGGGIYCEGSSPSIVQNIIRENWSNHKGGGIYCFASSPIISDNIIVNNHAFIEVSGLGGLGGGIYCSDKSSPRIQRNTITGNSAKGTYEGGRGGGIFSALSSPTIEHNTIAGNRSNRGGGIACETYASPSITNNVIRDNETRSDDDFVSWGGGIYVSYFSDALISNNIITGNESHYWFGARGGGIYLSRSSAVVVNNIIAENLAAAYYDGYTGYGGGIYTRESTLETSNIVFAGNRAVGSWPVPDGRGGGLACDESSDLVLTNMIFWEDDAEEGSEIWIGDASVLSIGYSDVGGGQYSVFVEDGSTLDVGPGNIDADPRFAIFRGFDYLLRRVSPCIDAGDPSIEDGLDWPAWYQNGTRSDMGAYGGPGTAEWLQGVGGDRGLTSRR